MSDLDPKDRLLMGLCIWLEEFSAAELIMRPRQVSADAQRFAADIRVVLGKPKG